MAQVQIADQTNDPYKNYPGGTPNFDEAAYASPTANQPSAPAPAMKTEQDFQKALGSLYDPSTYQSYVANVSNNGGGDPNDWFNRIVAKESLRGSNESNSSYTPNGQGGYTTGPTGKTNYPSITPAQTGTPSTPGSYNFPNPQYPSQFTDPISQMLEAFANSQRDRLTNPPQGSGQNLYENILKSISDQFQGGGYTPHEQELLNTQAMDPLEQLRKARQQQVITELSARGIGPTSGVYQSALADVNRQFDAMRAQQQTQLGVNAANQSTQRQLAAIQLLQQLADTQDTRNQQAFNYASVPYNMSQQAFQNASGLYGNAGNPLALIQPLLALQQNQQGQSAAQGQALGYLAYLLANGGLGL